MNGLNLACWGTYTGIKEVILSVRAQGNFLLKVFAKYGRKSNILIKQVQYHFEKEQNAELEIPLKDCNRDDILENYCCSGYKIPRRRVSNRGDV